MDLSKTTETVKRICFEAGFSFVGIAKAQYMDQEARQLEKWLNAGHHGEMAYMGNHFDLRVDPTRLVPGAKSVISLMYNYHTERKQDHHDAPRISSYAFGRDYHKVVRDKLKNILREFNAHFGEINGRGFVDSAPVLERDWARRAGNGWIGKNTMLINPKAGSRYFLAELITDLELNPDGPLKDYCGTCTRCIDACPTDAIAEHGYEMDGSKCISYLTIELKNAIPEEFRGNMQTWVFGCDICQDVCPWNRFSKQHKEPKFEPSYHLLELTADDWYEMSNEMFNSLFEGSAVKRTGYDGLKRNLRFIDSRESE